MSFFAVGSLQRPGLGGGLLLLLIPVNADPGDLPATETRPHEIDAGSVSESKFPIREKQPTRKGIYHGYL